jgi:hypothetical protein
MKRRRAINIVFSLISLLLLVVIAHQVSSGLRVL